MKLLGINTDDELKIDKHALEICIKVGRTLSALGQMSKLISFTKRKTCFKTLIHSF